MNFYKLFGSKLFLSKRFYIKNILFFGSDNFSLDCLKYLKDTKKFNLEVVTTPKNENSKLNSFCFDNNIKLHFPNSDTTLKNWNPEIGNIELAGIFIINRVIISFRYFIPPKLIDIFPKGSINLHPSL
jgi:methionyl-tRNA formyltransferase